jgi:hypothetical protein
MSPILWGTRPSCFLTASSNVALVQRAGQSMNRTSRPPLPPFTTAETASQKRA